MESFVFLLSANLVQLATTYYHHRTVGEYRVSDIVFDTIFAVIYAGFFIIVFFKNKTPFSEGAITLRGETHKFSLIIKWLGLIALKCALDVILIYNSRISVEWKYIGTDFFILAYWCFVYLVATKKISKIWKNKKHLLSALAVIVIAVGLAVCYDVYLIEQYHAVHLKYTEVSPHLVRVCRNLDFLHGVKTFILDTVIACVFIVFHTIGITNEEKEEYKQAGNGFRVFIRCNLIGSLFAILFAVKMAADPLGVLNNRGYQSIGSMNHEAEGPFDLWIESKGILHGMVNFSEENCYYFVEETSLQKSDRSEHFTFTGSESNIVFTDMGDVTHKYIYFSVDGKNVYLYGNYAICYYENNTPCIIRTDSLNQQSQNVIVTTLCKHLLEQGNLFVFEYAGEYLMKYEPQFIEPYLERYTNGTFTATEKEWLASSHYQENYIIDVAKDILKKIY